MQIIIDIPEKIYNRYINYTESYIDFVFVGTEEILVKAIRNGTPLPKGHGKLVDVEDVKNNIRTWRGYLDEHMMANINFTMDNNIPTIIEADKESDKDV